MADFDPDAQHVGAGTGFVFGVAIGGPALVDEPVDEPDADPESEPEA